MSFQINEQREEEAETRGVCLFCGGITASTTPPAGSTSNCVQNNSYKLCWLVADRTTQQHKVEDLQLTQRTAVKDNPRRYPMSVYESPFPANHLPLKPTFNSSNPFLNSTDHLEPSGSRSYTTGRSDSTSFGGDASDSSQPHPLKRSRGIKRGLDEVEQHVDTVSCPSLIYLQTGGTYSRTLIYRSCESRMICQIKSGMKTLAQYHHRGDPQNG
jgi:hypothetical protein